MSAVALVSPTWNNWPQCEEMVRSLIANTAEDFYTEYRVYLVNNGETGSCAWAKGIPNVNVLEPGSNLGWEGGLKYALDRLDGEDYVLLCNDDVLFAPYCREWLLSMVSDLDDGYGASGPISNVVMGLQNVGYHLQERTDVRYLIGYCMLVSRKALEKAGGIDDTLPGGDDLDLSIRIRNAGYRICVNPESFVWHHGFGSGQRKHGAHYNSPQMVQTTNDALIRKHGFKEWWLTVNQQQV